MFISSGVVVLPTGQMKGVVLLEEGVTLDFPGFHGHLVVVVKAWEDL